MSKTMRCKLKINPISNQEDRVFQVQNLNGDRVLVNPDLEYDCKEVNDGKDVRLIRFGYNVPNDIFDANFDILEDDEEDN